MPQRWRTAALPEASSRPPCQDWRKYWAAHYASLSLRKTQISLSLGVARIFGKVSVYFLWGICGSKTLPDRFKMRGTLASSFLRAGDGARSRDLGTGREDLPENRAAAWMLVLLSSRALPRTLAFTYGENSRACGCTGQSALTVHTLLRCL